MVVSASAATAGYAGGAMATAAGAYTAGLATGPGDAVICPVGILAGGLAGAAFVDYMDSVIP